MWRSDEFGFERVLDSFKLQNLKDSQQEALQNLIKMKMYSLLNQRGLENYYVTDKINGSRVQLSVRGGSKTGPARQRKSSQKRYELRHLI